MTGKGRKTKRKLEKVRSAARQQVGRLYIIAACLALLVFGCRSSSSSHTKRTCTSCTGRYRSMLHYYSSFFFSRTCNALAYV
ncbi:hypothetical protein GQ55_3G280800 [Panicum hallii var. hallii]|uniref:Uncharacterized protein n=1 Tax=Panicum hallii var. hallii TaxID=1504633 RepID=A0A2T7EE68_9POAL|nr:hypothetical protein GQ55_3G280800 [Panicum hallii var. hallii]